MARSPLALQHPATTGGWLLCSAAALALGFPLTETFSGWQPLAWAALIPLGLVIFSGGTARAFRLGWLAGTLAYTAILSWVVPTMQIYGQVPAAVSWLLLLLLAAYVGLYVGLFALGWRWFVDRWPVWGWLLAPPLWTALEWLRGHLLSGFPWSLFGYSQYRQLAMIQIADLAGIYGVSFLLVLVNVALAQALLAPSADARRRWAPALIAAAALLLAFGYGQWRLGAVEASLAPGPRVGLIQGNIPQAVKWDPAMRRETIARYERLTRQAAAEGAELIVWPEASAPFIFEQEPAYQETIRALAAETGRYLLFGSPAVSFERERPAMLNSAYLLNRDGTTQARYDKLHLVPFGEYVPLGPLLGFVNKLVVGIGDFIPGRGPVVMEAAGQPIGVAICFEIIFPEVVRQFPQQGARIIATITNDAWFGRSAAARQHFSMAVFRAVEHRTPVIRAANTGISGVIGATGRIERASDVMVEAALVQEVAVSPIRTVYTRVGDIFAVGCGILVAFFIITGRRRTPRA